jgi:hypothetical protein
VPCQGCHESINGIGYGLEAFDAIGKYRRKDNGVTVDANGKLSGTDVDGDYEGAVALSAKLAASKQARYCAVRNWYRYAFGRNERNQDWCKLDALYATLEQQGGDLRRMLVELTASYEFMHRPASSVHSGRGRAR